MVTREVLTLAQYDGRYGRLQENMRRYAVSVTRIYRSGVLTSQTVQLSSRLQFAGLHNSRLTAC